MESLTCSGCDRVFDHPGGNVVMCPHCGSQVVPLRAPGAARFLLDGNAYDPIVDAPDLADLIRDVCERGVIELLLTHIQRDELLADESRAAQTLALPLVITPTYGFVLGTSKLGMARLGEDEIDAIRSPTGGHTNDALLATTANYEGATLVTNDRRLTNFATREGIEVWNSERFIAHVRSIAT